MSLEIDALTDDLEAAIDRLLGYPEKTPNGEPIPTISRVIEPHAPSMLLHRFMFAIEIARFGGATSR